MFNVLSLDGGGIRGIYQLKVLKVLEKEVGNLNDFFDIIIGTSVGSMIAGYIRMGYTVSQIENKYMQNLLNVFEVKDIYEHIEYNSLKELVTNSNKKEKIGLEINAKISPLKSKKEFSKKYSDAIKKELNNIKINKPFYTVSLGITEQSLKIFEVNSKSSVEEFSNAIIASTALPLLFEPYEINGKLYSDGGILYNDPSLLALRQALEIEKDIKNIKIFSIGTLEEIKNIDEVGKNTLKDRIIEYISKDSDFIRYIKNKSTSKNNKKEDKVDNKVKGFTSVIPDYIAAYFSANNEGHRQILKTILEVFNVEKNYMRINHKVEHKTSALEYLYAYNDIVDKDTELINKIKDFFNN